MDRTDKIQTMREINKIIDKHVQDVLNALMIENLGLVELHGVIEVIKKYVLMDCMERGFMEYDDYTTAILTTSVLAYYNSLHDR